MKLRDVNLANHKKKQIVLLLLLVTTALYLLSNTKVYNFIFDKWNETRISFCLTRPDFELKTLPPPTKGVTPSKISTTQSKPDVPRCSYTYLSPENIKEGRRLLDSITWPETPPLPKGFSLSQTTSGAKSSFSIVPRIGGWRVGDELRVNIQLRDFNGNSKRSGGDFIVSRLHNRQLGAGVVGQVHDHRNGSFTAVFPLLWNGMAHVEVMLVQTSESITVLKRLTEEQPDRIFFASEFKSGSVKEKTICNICLDPDKGPLCNFTDLSTREPWFCYKPKTLDCDTRVGHSSQGGFSGKISKEEEALFQNGVNMKALIKASGNETIWILPKADGSKEKNARPSGYYFKNQWRSLRGSDVRQFDNASVITDCLKGKQLHLLGDSTIRQFYEHITKSVPNLLRFDKHTSSQTGPFLALDPKNDIMVTFRSHSTPLRFMYVLASQLRYVANELDGLSGGKNTVVVLSVWAHFSTYPLEVYYQRLMTIRRALKRLLNRDPETKVIIRSANMKEMNLFKSLTASDWFSLQRDKVLRALFKDMDILFLDAWEMVQAHYLPHNLHPPSAIIKQMVDIVLSHTCKTTGLK